MRAELANWIRIESRARCVYELPAKFPNEYGSAGGQSYLKTVLRKGTPKQQKPCFIFKSWKTY